MSRPSTGYINAMLNHSHWAKGRYGEGYLTCKFCQTTISTAKGYYTLKRHEEGSRHIKKVTQQRNNPTTNAKDKGKQRSNPTTNAKDEDKKRKRSAPGEEDPDYKPSSSKAKQGGSKKRRSNTENEEPNTGGSKSSGKTRNTGGSKSSGKTRNTGGSKSSGKTRKTKMEKIVELLKQMGVEDPERQVGWCVKAAIYKGHVQITGDPADLEMVVHRERNSCGHVIEATLGDLLQQPDYGGGEDYEEYITEATVYCKNEACTRDPDNLDDEYNWGFEETGRVYVTGLCKGQPSFSDGKFHNHCTECTKGFGVCIGDMVHCRRCGKHFWRGSFGLSCPCKGRRIHNAISESDDDLDL